MNDHDLQRENDELRRELAAAHEELRRLRGEGGEAVSSPEAARDRLFSVLSMLPGYVCLLSPDYRFRFVNQRFLDLFGDPGDRHCHKALFDRDEPCEDCQSFQCLQCNEPRVWEWQAPTGALYEVYDYPFPDPEAGWLVLEVGFDITERKQAADELARYRDHLEQLVTERTTELAEANAQLQYEMARHRVAAEALAHQNELLETLFSSSLTCIALLDRDFNFLRVNEPYAAADAKRPEDFPGHNHFELYPSAENEAIFREVMESKRPYSIEARPFAYPGSPERGVSYWDWSLVPVLDARGEVDCLLFSLSDVTTRTRAELQNRAIIDLLQTVTLAPDLEALAAALVAHLRRWTGCEAAAVRLRQGEDFPFLAAEGYPAGLLEAEASLTARNACGGLVRGEDGEPLFECLCGCVLDPGAAGEHPYLTDHGSFCANNCRGFLAEHGTELPERMRGRCVAEGYQSLAIIPLRLEGEAFGLLHLGDCRPGLFDEATLQVLERLADTLAIALAHGAARADLLRHQHDLRALAAQLARTEEQQRLRIATVLHDDLCQTLGFTKMRLAALQQCHTKDEARPIIEEIRRLLDESIRFTRNLTVELSPPVLQRFGLGAALRWLAERVQSRQGLPVECDCDHDCLLDSETATILYRSVRELVTNAIKYAEATRLRIWMECTDTDVVVGVADDGKGFIPGEERISSEAGGFGLFSIRESLAHEGGELTIESAPGAGTTCRLRLPLVAP